MTRKPSTKVHPVDIITRGICASCFVFLATAAGAGISYLISVAGGL
jgi:hypothetical protein